MNPLRLTLRQVYYENRAFWRNPQTAFFTFAFPLLFLVVFNSIFGNYDVDQGGGTNRSSSSLKNGELIVKTITALK